MSQHSDFATSRSSQFCNQLFSKKGVLGSPEIPFRQVASDKKAKAGIVASALRSGLGCFLALTVWLCGGSLARAQFPATNVGTTSGALPVSVTVSPSASTSEATAQVLTMGISGLDFKTSDPSPCNGKSAGQSCILSVTFTPSAPGLRAGAVQLLDNNGKVLGYTLISGTGKGGLGVLLSGNLQIVAGDGTVTQPVSDPENALTAELFHPSSVVLDGAGSLYISDTFHYRIRKVTFSGVAPNIVGTISTIAGTGVQGFSGDGGPATSAQLDTPNGLALDGAGNLFIADTGNHAIRMISAATSSTPGDITTVAGILGQKSLPGTIGNGGLATAATLNFPQGVAIDSVGNIWIADTGNNEIREVTANLIINLMAGSPTGAQGSTDTGSTATALLDSPWAVAVDPLGNFYIADTGNNRVLNVVGLTVKAFAGNETQGLPTDGQSATTQALNSPSGLAIDAADNVYFTVRGGSTDSEICKVNTNGFISTVAKNVTAAANSTIPASLYAADNLFAPVGLAIDGNGNIFFADWGNYEVKEIPGNQGFLDFTPVAVRQGQLSNPLLKTLENDGNQPLNVTGFTVVPNTNSSYPSINANVSSTCSLTVPLNPDSDCSISVVFAPGISPLLPNGKTQLTTLIDATNSTPDSPLVITAYGLATNLSSTSVALPPSPMTAIYGAATPLLTATVTTGLGTQNLTGNVIFYDAYNGASSYTAIPPVTGVKVGSTVSTTVETATAGLNISALQVGVHSIYACYNQSLSDSFHSSSCSTDNGGGFLALTVYQNTTTALPASVPPAIVGSTVTFTATVSATNGAGVPLTGTVDFILGASTPVCSGRTLSQSTPTTWTATCSTATLPQGNNSITAVYSGDPAEPIYGSTSKPLIQDMQSPTTATLVSSLPISNYGAPVTFTFTVAGITGTFAAPETATFSYGNITPVKVTSSNGTWTWTTSTLPVSTTPLTINASYPGDTNYAPAAASVSQQVNPAATTTVLIAPATGISGLPTAMSATVTATTGSGTPTGSVTFMDGTTPLGSAAPLVNGKATLNPSLPLPVGLNSLTAVYSGDGNDSTSTSAAVPVAISPGTTTIAFVNPPTTTVVEFPVSFTVQVASNGVTPTGSVVFFDESTPIGTVALVGGAATLTYTFTTTSATSPHSITATYAGDANNAPPAVGILPDPITVTAIPTQTTLVQASTSGANPTLILIASVVGVDLPSQFPPTGTVVFTNGTATLGSAQLVDGVATFQPSATGALNVIATYSPTLAPVDPLHLGSASSPLSVTNNGNGFTLNATPPKLTISPTQNATVTLTITPVNGFKDTVGLGCASLPPGMTCTFSSLTTVLDGTNPNSITLTIDTNNPLLGGATAMNTPGAKARFTLASIFWPFGLLTGLLLWRFRKLSALLRNALLILVFAGTAVLVNGCGGIGKSAAVPGTYSIQVVGVGINSNISQYVTLTVVVTK